MTDPVLTITYPNGKSLSFKELADRLNISSAAIYTRWERLAKKYEVTTPDDLPIEGINKLLQVKSKNKQPHIIESTATGERNTITGWAAKFGISRQALYERIERHGEQNALNMGPNKR